MSNDTLKELHRLRQADRVLKEFIIEEMCEIYPASGILFHDVVLEIIRRYYNGRMDSHYFHYGRGSSDLICDLERKMKHVCRQSDLAFGGQKGWDMLRITFVFDAIEFWLGARGN